MSDAGRIWTGERRALRDATSGAEVLRLTSLRGHSHHLYFTEDGWWDAGRRLLFASERGRGWNLCSADPESGDIVQHTDLATDGERPQGLQACRNGVRDEAYVLHGRDLLAVDLRRNATRPLWSAPEGWDPGLASVTADGAQVLICLDETSPIRVGEGVAYGNYRERFRARLRGRIVEIPVDGGPARTLHEEIAWLTHVNCSPTRPGLVAFCHEGPWDEVDQRIWGLDRASGRTWAIRPRDDGACVAHEFWCADGETIGYHARFPAPSPRHLIGFCRHDNSWRLDDAVTPQTQHAHALTSDLAVGDGIRSEGDGIVLWRREAGRLAAPRLLCRHDSSRHFHHAHAHPRLTPDGQAVVFTSDRRGYADVHVARIGDIERLPVYDARPRRFYWQ